MCAGAKAAAMRRTAARKGEHTHAGEDLEVSPVPSGDDLAR